MPMYVVEAMDPKGKRVRADIEAGSPQDAIAKVKGKGYKPMNVKEKSGADSSAKTPAAAPGTPASSGSGPAPAATASAIPAAPPAKSAKKGISFGVGRVKHKQLTQFTQQL